MLEYFGALFTTVVDLFKLEFTLFGFTLSLWQVFLFDIVVSIVVWIVVEVIHGD